MRYMLCETVRHYHEVDIDDELDMQEIVNNANKIKDEFDTGYEAVEHILSGYNDGYGFEYEVMPNSMGTETIDITIIDEL